MDKDNKDTVEVNILTENEAKKERQLDESAEDKLDNFKSEELSSHENPKKHADIEENKGNKYNDPPLETDHLDQIHDQDKADGNDNDSSSEAPSKKNVDEEKARRTVTVVEHSNGFKSKALKNKIAPPSSSDSNREPDIKNRSSYEKSSMQGISEKSRRLSPNSSTKDIPKEEGVFDYQVKPNSPENLSSSNKNSVKFKEDEEYFEEEGSVLPAERENNGNISDSKDASTHENKPKNSNTKITSILKNGSRDKNSDLYKEVSVRMSLNKLYDTDKDNTLDKEPTSSETSENKQSNKPKKRKIIPNMVVEEDQINLSDLGNGPEKPKIKTIVKKMMSKKEKGTEEPTPSKTVKTYLKSPESSKSNSTVKKTPISSKKQKSQGSIKEVQNFSPDDSASEYMESSADLDYQPVSEFVDYKELSAHPNFKIKKYKDAIYRGMIDPETHQRQGIGIMEYITGRIYEGAWNKDLREGEGYERYANNNIYKGNFLRGKAHGQGNYQWANGEYYNGEWNQGQKHGYGEWKSHDGDSYEGEWKEGKADGQGVYTWKNGDRYDGDWLVCLKHGKGTDYFANGDSYTGQYKYGKPWGTGIYTWRNGSAYKGQFKNGLKHGKGKWTKGEGDEKCVFEGNYVKGKKQGYGEFKWASGNFYRGEYKGDERHGYGEMYWNDDSFYKGAWVNGIQHGQGIMQLADGTVKKGTFENNIFIEEVMEECESVESSAMEEYDESPQNVVSQKINKKKGKKKRNRDEPSLLPSIASQNTIPTKSARKFSSAQKSLARNLSDANIRKGGIIQFNSARRFRNSSKKRGKNSLSLPKIGSANQESAVSSRLKGFTSVAKNQAKERKKLESYFKSLDKAVQILRDKKQHELANRPWIPAGPVQQYQYRPSSKYG